MKCRCGESFLHCFYSFTSWAAEVLPSLPFVAVPPRAVPGSSAGGAEQQWPPQGWGAEAGRAGGAGALEQPHRTWQKAKQKKRSLEDHTC